MLTDKRPILLTGVNGQVGEELLPLLRGFGQVIAPTRHELNLSDPDAIRKYVRGLQPRWIVNPAAYTAVDKAESEPEVAFAINATAPTVLGEEAAARDIPVLHFSTDYVFAGDGTTPWKEDDPTGPLGVYGKSKLAGEQGLAESGAAHLIYRTSWVFGASGNNFLRTILRLARERDEMNIVADQHGSPTWSRDLARLATHTIEITEALADREKLEINEAAQTLTGVYHACGSGFTTWFGFAQEFLRLAQVQEPEQRFARLKAIASAEYPTPAKRPSNSRMNCEKLIARLGFKMPAWQESTARVMDEIGSRRSA
jgi:dTDP-4-dehydrorhamnose reductase